VARRGVWKETHWEFQDVTEYLMDNRGRILGEPRTFTSKVYPDVTFTPADLASASSESMFLSYRELKSSIQKLEDNGVNVKTETVDLHSRLASPWQALVMMLLTVPFMAKKLNRRAIAFQVLLCVAVIFAFHLTGALGLALGKAGKTLPFLSAWAGNIIFGLGALFYLDRANY
jgi:lipopolysaccharide export system permease protein